MMGCRGKKFVAIAGVAADVLVSLATTPVLARGCHCDLRHGGFHAYRASWTGARIRYGHGAYSRWADAPFARAVNRFYVHGYGGYLRYHFDNGVLVPDYVGIPVPHGPYRYPYQTTYSPLADLILLH